MTRRSPTTFANIDRLRFTFGYRHCGNHLKGRQESVGSPPAGSDTAYGGWVTEKDITIKGKTTSQYLASVVVDNLPPRPFNIRMRR